MEDMTYNYSKVPHGLAYPKCNFGNRENKQYKGQKRCAEQFCEGTNGNSV